ncbi:MAG: hypothetical protein IJ150_10035 [Bacteroidales bacterium]|nr:hypothetical protein [Bacteroidales bacterium]
MQENSKSTVNKVLLALVIAEAIAILVLFINKGKQEKEAEEMMQKIEIGNNQKDSLNREMEIILDNYNQLQTTNDTINAQLAEQKAKVEELMTTLKRTKASNLDSLKKYRAEVETLRSIMRSFVVQIDSLNTKNQILTEENNRLSGQLSNARQQNKQLSNVKDSLQGRVKEAETLKAQGIKLVALNDRDNETSRILKTKKFRVTFTLSENEMTKKGEKDLMVRLVKPDGSILMNESSGFFNYQGKEIAYSSKKNVNYDGKAQNAVVYVISREMLSAGNYQADVFCEGRNIGSVTININ